MKLRLNSITYAAQDINLFEFVPTEKEALPAAEAGAHIGLHLPNGLLRQYSLINNSENPASYTVGVKREDNGKGGSLYMHQSLSVGTVIEVDPPRNNFPLIENNEHYVLIGGGIGVTPVYSMMHYLKAQGKSFDFYYACRSKEDAIFLDELAAEPSTHLHFDDDAGTFFDMQGAIDSAPAGSHFYCCGPGPMLGGYEAATEKLPKAQVHLEYFSAEIELAAEGGYTVVLAQSGTEYQVEEGKTILQTLTDAGIDMPFSCEQGVCGACETAVLEGVPDHRDMILTDDEREANNTMMVCCSGSKTDRLVLDI